jgi:outer membrane protein TolC
LSGDATFTRRTTPRISSTDLTGGFSNTVTANLILQRALESGGRVTLSAQGTGLNTNSRIQGCGTFDPTLPAPECTVYSNSVLLTFSHPLLRGFGAEIAQANLRRSRIQRDLALLNRQARAANVVRDTINAYWELAYQTQDLEIRRSAVELARQQLRTTQAQIDVGRFGVLELAAVERAIAEREQEVALAEQELALRSLDLQRLFGVAPPASFAGYRASDRPNAAGHEVDIAAEVARALETSPALKSLKMGLKLTEIDLLVAEAAVRPQLDLVATAGATGRRTDLGESLSQTGNLENPTWSAGLVFQLPVQNRSARGAAASARLSGQLAELDAADLEIAIRDGVARLAARIRAASRRIELSRAAIGFADKNLTAEKARFDVGRATNNDVLLRQQELKQAEIHLARATIDLLTSDTALAALTGEILERYGIVLKGS